MCSTDVQRAKTLSLCKIQRAIQSVIEPLENRQLLAATLNAGALTVDGTGGDDNIQLDLQSGNIVVSINGAQQIFDAAQVTSIQVNGLAGNDRLALGHALPGATLSGGDGNDTLVSGTRDDTSPAGAGDDRLIGGDDDDTYVFADDWGSDIIEENSNGGNDTLDFSAVNASLVSTIGALEVHDDHNSANHGGQEVENVIGGLGNDVFFFNDGASIAGTLDGGTGSNTLVYSDYTTAIAVNLANHTATGAGAIAHINNVVGGQGNDTLTGDSGNNSLTGGPGSDLLQGGGGIDTFPQSPTDLTGADTISGSGGQAIPLDFSTYATPLVFNISLTGVTVSSGGTTIASAPLGGALTGGSANDQFIFANGAAYNGSIDGSGGANTLDYTAYTTPVTVKLGISATGTTSATHVSNVNGGSANDILVGDALANLLKGNGGNDKIYGQGGNDKLYGAAGRDVLKGAAGNDLLRGGADNDVLSGGAGNDKILGDAGNDKIQGDANDDKIYGGTGNDTLVGGTGKDLLSGDAGNDLLNSRDKSKDAVKGGAGADKAQRDLLDSVATVESILK